MTELQQTYLIISDPLSDVVLVLRLILLVLIIWELGMHYAILNVMVALRSAL